MQNACVICKTEEPMYSYSGYCYFLQMAIYCLSTFDIMNFACDYMTGPHTILHYIYIPRLKSFKTLPASCQPIDNQSPSNRSTSPTNWQSVVNKSPTSPGLVSDWSLILINSSRPPIANWSTTGRRLIANWSATKKWQFWSHNSCLGCSWFLFAKQSPTVCGSCMIGA